MSINPLTTTLAVITGGRLGAVVEPGVRDVDVAEARSDVAIADLPDVVQPFGDDPTLPLPVRHFAVAPRADRKSHRNRRFTIAKILRRTWIPLLILVVLGAGGLTVARLHGIFGSEKRPAYADSQINDTKPFDPKHLTYEVFGPPGTVAKISYFDANADPKRVDAAPLPWSLTFAITDATAVGSVVAQGDSDDIGCRIVVDGVVKAEKITHETHAFTFCSLKAS
jgi:MmpS family membrane protein